jgi:hypothetical protein
VKSDFGPSGLALNGILLDTALRKTHHENAFTCSFKTPMKTLDDINRLIAATEAELAELESSRSKLLSRAAALQRERAALVQSPSTPDVNYKPIVTNQSSQEEKIVLFRSLFRGREDIYPRRFESLKTGKQGYQPACRNEWVRGICEKPKIRCEDCMQ